jgi:SAM-dependent methyltransferase
MSLTGSRFTPALWPLDSFEAIETMRTLYRDDAHRVTRYPVRHLRYWFIRSQLERHARRLGRPLAVLEVGMDRGQMLAFMNHGCVRNPIVDRWDAIDVAPKAEWVERVGYDSVRALDIDRGTDPRLERRYDAMVFLHVLEHLHEPEATMRAFLRYLPSDGVFLAGGPTMPALVANAGYERRLRRRAAPFGHVSVISPERVDAFAESAGVDVTFMSGAFFMRKSGHPIERSRLWLRLNLAFGNLFPSLGSELYFSLEKERG